MHTSIAQLGFLVTFVICAMAFIFGDRRLKTASAVYAIEAILVIAIQLCLPQYMQPLFIGLDVICFIIFLNLSWKANYVWPVLATVCQLFSIASQLKPLLDSHYSLWAAFTLLYFSGYGVLLALGYGTFEVQAATSKLRLKANK